MGRFSVNRIPVKYLLWIVLFLSVTLVYQRWNAVSFGDTFPNPLKTKNVHLGCEFNGLPICCSLVDENSPYSKHVETIKSGESKCFVTKAYEPSPYEMKHIQKAQKISTITDEKERRDELLVFMFDDIADSNLWLGRIRDRMLSAGTSLQPNSVDWDFLSHFVVTEECVTKDAKSVGTVTSTKTWYEWIEPLTVHMRHPFGFTQCFHGRSFEPYWVAAFQERAHSMNFPAGLMLSDYVLLHSHHEHEGTVSEVSKPAKEEAGQHGYPHNNISHTLKPPSPHPRPPHLRHPLPKKMQPSMANVPNNRQLNEAGAALSVSKNEPSARIKSSRGGGRNFFLDAGTSTFDSALFWFVCGYLQVCIA